MSTIHREIGLSLYRLVTTRMRSRMFDSFERRAKFPAAILFYHRVATQSMNAWSIQKQNFELQLDWIAKHASPASLDDIRESQMLGVRRRPMVGVTFDDGYGENCEYAIPALIDRGIPCTYFVSTHFVETGRPFPHDLARGVPLRPNTIQEIQNMANLGIEIGAHSHTHADFGRRMSKAELRIEITDVRKQLQDWTGQSINYFAFPFGLKKNISQEAIDVVFESGFRCFVSAAGGLNFLGQNPNHMQRIHGDPGMAAMKNWLTFDPRKIRAKNPFDCQFRLPTPKIALA